MPPSNSGRCCQSVPRCRACPVWRAADLVAVRELTAPELELPPHLTGVPRCLHKYEPLLREAWEQAAGGEDPATEPAAA